MRRVQLFDSFWRWVDRVEEGDKEGESRKAEKKERREKSVGD